MFLELKEQHTTHWHPMKHKAGLRAHWCNQSMVKTIVIYIHENFLGFQSRLYSMLLSQENETFDQSYPRSPLSTYIYVDKSYILEERKNGYGL